MKKLLYVAPHLSTGGLPQYLTKKIELLKDEDHRVRHWAASAMGHRLSDGVFSKKMSNFIIQRLLDSAHTELNPNARAGIAYGLRTLIENDNLGNSFRDHIQHELTILMTDVNYQVRRLAIG